MITINPYGLPLSAGCTFMMMRIKYNEMKNLLGLIFTMAVLLTSGQVEQQKILEKPMLNPDYYLDVNLDNVCGLSESAFQNGDLSQEEQLKKLFIEGICQKLNGSLDSAYLFFSRAQTLARQAEISKELGVAYWYRANVLAEIGELERAEELYLKALEKLRALEQEKESVSVLSELASVEQALGNLYESIAAHEEVLEISKRQGMTKLELRSYLGIAEVYLELGNVKQGLAYNLRLLEATRKKADCRNDRLKALVQRGYLYGPANQDSASHYFETALASFNHVEANKPLVYFQIATYYTKRGDHKEAIVKLRQALKFVGDDAHGLASTMLSKNYLSLNNYDSALYFALKGYDLGQYSEVDALVTESLKLLADICKEKGDIENSNYYLYKYAEREDRNSSKDGLNSRANLVTQLEEIDRQQEIALLTLNAELEAFKRLMVLRLGTLVVAILVAIIGWIYSRSKSRQKRNKFKNASLRNELEKGRHDLHNHSLHLIRVNNSVLEIEEKLKELKPKVQGHSMEVQRLINIIKVNKSQEKDWDNFNNYFNDLNTGFADELRQKFPTLTLNEIRLCSLLKMNLLNGEIASILSVETRSVTMSKYRMKKKMDLGEDVDLASFLRNMEFEEEKKYA